jgi:hypothetical protein
MRIIAVTKTPNSSIIIVRFSSTAKEIFSMLYIAKRKIPARIVMEINIQLAMAFALFSSLKSSISL